MTKNVLHKSYANRTLYSVMYQNADFEFKKNADSWFKKNADLLKIMRTFARVRILVRGLKFGH